MKAFFIFRDGELFGSQIGYTTKAGALKSLVGCDDWNSLLHPYESKLSEDLNGMEKLSGIWKQSLLDPQTWLFQRDVWSRKVWNPYVKEHYKIVEKEFDIVFKD